MFSFTLLATTVSIRWIDLAGEYGPSVVATREDGGYITWTPEDGEFGGIPYLGII